MAAAIALSSAAISSAYAGVTGCSTKSSVGLISGGGPYTSGDLSFSSLSLSYICGPSGDGSPSGYSAPGSGATVVTGLGTSPYGINVNPSSNHNFGIVSSSHTMDVTLKYKVAATGNNLIEDTNIHFQGLTSSKTKEKEWNGFKYVTVTHTKDFGTIKDTEVVKTAGGKHVTVTTDTPSHSKDVLLGFSAKSITVTQNIVLHALNNSKSVELTNITDEFSTTTTTPVPEPTTLALLGIGLTGLGALRRRRQRKPA